MSTVTFYVMQADSPQSTDSGFEEYVVFLLHHFASQNVKLYLNCANKEHAHYWDDKLFSQGGTQFIAHNLIGEGPRYGTPLEIGYAALKPSFNRNLLININLDNNETIFARSASQVIEFVPCSEKQKQASRERYKRYREAGFEVQTVNVDTSN
jgi:DNA polymerase-3 subunit chi